MSTAKTIGSRFANNKLAKWVSGSIRNKLLVTMLVAALVPLIAVSVVINSFASSSLMEQTFDRMTAVRTIKQQQLNNYLNTIKGQAATFAEDRMIVEAMEDFRTSFSKSRLENETTRADLDRMRDELKNYYSNQFGGEFEKRNPGKGKGQDAVRNLGMLDDDSVFHQYNYIEANKHELGKKNQLLRPAASLDKSKYSELHAQFHPVIDSYREKFGYYDVFLVDATSGRIVYTAFKELDFTTSLKDGPYASTNLGRCFRMIRDKATPGFVGMVDYEAYLPSYNDAAGFIGSPIYSGSQLIGVLLFQIPIDKIEAIMAERTGLGETGETYAVGPAGVGETRKNLFRNRSRFTDDLHKSLKLAEPLKTTIINPLVSVDTLATQEGLKGQSGTKVINDYRGEPVLSSWSPLKVYEAADEKDAINWVMISEMDLAEVRQPTNWMTRATILAVLIGTLLVFGVAFWFSNSATKQTTNINNMLAKISQGDYTSRATVSTQDELGQMAGSLNKVLDKTLLLVQSEKERDQMQLAFMKLMEEVSDVANGDLTVEAEVTADMTGAIADSFNYMIVQLRKVINSVKDSTQQVTTTAEEIRSATEHLSNGSESQASQLLETSSALGQMAVSIQQVAENVTESSTVAEQARANAQVGRQAVQRTISGMNRIREQVQESSKRFKRLGESSQAVGEIVQLISDIADRTSILALNASIQAAMAGDAGRGFAVVAEEVERLAERANSATNDIASLIKTIQTESAEAIAAMEESTREVVSGSQLAQEAGTALGEIESVSERLAQLITEISSATTQQARGAEALSLSMTEISAVTQHTAAGTRQAAVSVSRLAMMAQELRGSVEAFKVPATTA